MSHFLQELRRTFISHCSLLYQQGLCCANAGNVSIRFPDGYLCSPSGRSLGTLREEDISQLDRDGRLVLGEKPTKEVAFHLAWYEANPHHNAIVHLHSPFATAYSCLDGLDETDALPPMTPYQIMKLGRIPKAPYAPPGSPLLAEFVARFSTGASALFLANHGFITGGKDLAAAAERAMELESSCKLFFILMDSKVSLLKQHEVDVLLSGRTS